MKQKVLETVMRWKRGAARALALGLCAGMLLGGIPVYAETTDQTTTEDTDTENTGDDSTPTETEPVETTKKSQTIKLTNAKKVYKTSDLVLSARGFNILTSASSGGSGSTGSNLGTYETGYDETNDKPVIASAKTSLSYQVIRGSNYVSVSKSGRVKIKKGTPKGTYKIRITAKETKAYKAATKTVSIVVKASNELKNANVCWDLKNNKTVTYETAFSDSMYENVFFKSGKVTMKNYKVTKADKAGYKKLTFDLVFELPVSFTKSQVDAILDTYWAWEYWENNVYYTVVDYDTGECLENKNTKNVTVKASKWKWTNTKKSYGTGDNWVQFSRDGSVSVTVTYPSDYKNLCIVAGGYSSDGGDNAYVSAGDAFFSGKTTFLYASNLYYGKDVAGKKKLSTHKKVCHAIRVK